MIDDRWSWFSHWILSVKGGKGKELTMIKQQGFQEQGIDWFWLYSLHSYFLDLQFIVSFDWSRPSFSSPSHTKPILKSDWLFVNLRKILEYFIIRTEYSINIVVVEQIRAAGDRCWCRLCWVPWPRLAMARSEDCFHCHRSMIAVWRH